MESREGDSAVLLGEELALVLCEGVVQLEVAVAFCG
jgi:hypothetical protein